MYDNKNMSAQGITSGLTVQSKYRKGFFPSSYSKSHSVLTRPYTDGFDSGVKVTSDPHKVENGRPVYSIPKSIGYRQVFGKGSTPDERAYYLDKALNRIERISMNRPTGKQIRKSKAPKLSAQEKELQALVDMVSFSLDKYQSNPVNINYRDKLVSELSTPQYQSPRSMSVSSFGEAPSLTSDQAEFYEQLGLALGDTDIAKMDLISPRISTPSAVMSTEMISEASTPRSSFSGQSLNIPIPPPPPPSLPPLVDRIAQSVSNRMKNGSVAKRNTPSFDEELRKAVIKRSSSESDNSDIESLIKKQRTDQFLKRKMEEEKAQNYLNELKRKVAKIE
jgi:hypothetical protein